MSDSIGSKHELERFIALGSGYSYLEGRRSSSRLSPSYSKVDSLPKHNAWAFFFLKVVAGAITFAAVIMTLWTIGPWVETKFFPVVSKLQVDEIVDDNGRTKLLVHFNKLRSCDYVGIAWFRGTKATSFERVAVELTRSASDQSSPNRPTGLQRSGPWYVSMSKRELQQNSFAVLYHKCHWFWVTETDFYP